MSSYRSRSKSRSSSRRHTHHYSSDDHSIHHHTHSRRSDGNYHHHHHGDSYSLESDRPRKEYHGHHRQRYRAASRHYYDSSHSHKHYSHRSSSPEVEIDDESGNYIGEPGTILNDRYEIQRELGTGTFARAFQVRDINTGKELAVKIVRSVHRYCKSAKIEAKIARDITSRDNTHTSHCYHLYDEFEFSGHYCMVMDLLGSSLYDVLKHNNYVSFPILYIRPILHNLLEALQFMHGFGLTHTDLKLENLLFTSMKGEHEMKNDLGQTILLPASPDVTLIDYGSATYSTEHRKGIINTRQYRAPEVILGLEWDEESDIWGVACIAMELFTGDLLFQTHDDLLHFALIEQIVGKIPEKMLRKASSRKQRYFDENGHFLLDELHHSEQKHVENMKTLKEMIGPEFPQFYDLMSRCLIISPNLRITAAEALKHPFFNGKN